MSGDVRLDPATLRHVAARLRAELLPAVAHSASGALAVLRSGIGVTISDDERDTLAVLADIGTDLEVAIVAIETDALEAESRPPLLSDWFRACEVAALGPAHPWRGDDRLRWGPDDDAPWWWVHVDLPSDDAHPHDRDCARVWMRGVERARCATPSELRAALDRLAAEAAR